MAWAALLVHALHELAWPAAVIWVAWYFRDAIVAQLPRVTKVGPVSLEAAATQQTSTGRTVISDETIRKIEGSVPADLLQEGRESIKKALPDSAGKDELLSLSSALLISGLFERIYANIFGSQVVLLQQVNTSPMSLPDARKIYERAKAIYPQVYENYSFDEWLSFIISFLLVSKTPDEKLVITLRGKGFLRYIVDNGYSPARPN